MQVIFQFMQVIFNKKKSVILVATTFCMQCLRAAHALSSDQYGYITVHEGYILVHEGYIPVHAGYIPVHEGYIQEKIQWF